MPEKTFSIREVAIATGVSAYTLRYYERVGLLGNVARSNSGHRSFSQADCDWVVFLSRLRLTGMPIRTMQKYAVLRAQGDESAKARRELLEAHRTTICQQLQQLQSNLSLIDRKIELYRNIEES
ncbi:MerR family transcriptional regulator [bacterium]|nr:MAG: MerR family transcriptional regulator [bacterium]